MRAPAARCVALSGVVFVAGTGSDSANEKGEADRKSVSPRLSFYLRDCRRLAASGCPFGGPL